MGMNWLHSSDPPVIHRDLKPANVLLTTSRRPGDEETIVREKRVKEIEKDLMAKVTDMGLSKLMTKQLKADGAGSNLWMAPELLKYQYYDAKVDVYSFALLVWQVLTWTRNPFQDYLDKGDLDVFVEAVYHHHVRPEIPKGTHPKLIELMDAGWAHLAKDRPDFSDIVMMLDDCFITTLFKDEHYASFWKKNWGAKILHKERRVEPAKEVLPFSVFANALYDYLSNFGVIKPENLESDVYYLCLKVIVADPKEVTPSVTLERLLLIEKWFGPLVDETPKKSPRKSSRTTNTTLKIEPINTTKIQLNEPSQISPRKTKLKKEKRDVLYHQT
jgi:serine/threonine protein kinase